MILMSQKHLITVSCQRREDLPFLARAGFEGADFGFYTVDPNNGWLSQQNYREQASQIAETAQELGIAITQAHTYILGYHDYVNGNQNAITAFQRSLEASALIGSPCTVVHPLIAPDCIYGENMQSCLNVNLKFLQEVFELGDRYGVEICLENMFNWHPGTLVPVRTIGSTAESLLEITDKLGQSQAFFCVDVGHAILTNQAPQVLLRKLKNRVRILHLHDNNLTYDDHMPPYLGRLNWGEILCALKEIGYTGNLNFETIFFEKRYPEALLEDAYRFLYRIGCYLRNELEKLEADSN